MTVKKKGNAVAVRNDVNVLLDELVSHRVNTNSLIANKVSVVADLIIKAHKKECK
jgi:hypothetical protein